MFPAHLSKYGDSENKNNNKKNDRKTKINTHKEEKKIRRLYLLNCPPGGAVDHFNGADKLGRTNGE